MAKANSAVTQFENLSYLQGISQQAAQIAAPLTVADSRNVMFDPIRGVYRRPPMKRLYSVENDDIPRYTFVSPFTGNLTVIKLGNPITMIDLITGLPITVTQAASTNSYIAGGVTFTVVGDYITMFNPTKKVAVTSLNQTTTTKAVIFCRGSFVASTTYEIYKTFKGVQTTIASYHTGSLTADVIAADLTADIVAAQPTWGALRSGSTIICDPNPGLSPSSYSIVGTQCTITQPAHGRLVGSTVDVDFTTGTNYTKGVNGIYTITGVTTNTYTFTHPTMNTSGECLCDYTKLSVSDKAAGDVIRICQRSVETISQLPVDNFNGFEILVSGSANNDDRYYVKFRTTSGNASGVGVYEESSKPEDRFTFDATTIPHGLKYNPDGSVNIIPLPLDTRRYGDKESSPHPSFVGTTIQDMQLHKGRLSVLSNRGVDLSDAGDVFSFYRDTTKVLKDSAPVSLLIGLQSLDEKALYLSSFQGELLIYTTQAIFALFTNQEDLTASTATINKQSNVAIKENVRPVGVSTSSIAITPGQAGLKVMETFRQEVGLYITNSLSDKVPYIISPDCFKLAASHRLSMVWVANGQDLICYQYLVQGQERTQQAFGLHTHPYDTLTDMILLDGEGLLVTGGIIGDTYCIHQMSLNVNDVLSPDLPYQIHLDDQVVCSANAITTTHPMLSYDVTRVDRAAILTDDYLSSTYEVVGYNLSDGVCVSITPYITPNYIYIPVECNEVVFGRSMYSYLKLHTIYMENQGIKNLQPMQIHRMAINTIDTGGIQLKKTNNVTQAVFTENKLASNINTPLSFLNKLQRATKQFVFERIGINTNVEVEIGSVKWFPVTIGKVTFQGESHGTVFGI
jgi:hypothetical protein